MLRKYRFLYLIKRFLIKNNKLQINQIIKKKFSNTFLKSDLEKKQLEIHE